MHALARCEDQLNHEFLNGASRVFASEDLLRPDASGARGLRDDLFVGLPDDPANVGVTVYSPHPCGRAATWPANRIFCEAARVY